METRAVKTSQNQHSGRSAKPWANRRVAEEAGVPLGSTTQYFKSIDELRREGYKLASLAIVDEMGDNGSLKFRETEY